MSALDMAAILAAEDATQKAWEANTYHGAYTIAELRAAFDLALAPGQNWKAPIRTVVTEQNRDLMVAAVEYFVGGPTKVEPREFTSGGMQVTLLVLENAGYYVNIGA
jgi:hypothetical protein